VPPFAERVLSAPESKKFFAGNHLDTCGYTISREIHWGLSVSPVGCRSDPLRDGQQVDCLAQYGIRVGVDLVRELRTGVFQQSLGHCRGHASLSQQRGKGLSGNLECQDGDLDQRAYPAPLLHTESVGEKPLLAFWECGNVVGQLHHDHLRDGSF
jgi:hypothetical protein